MLGIEGNCGLYSVVRRILVLIRNFAVLLLRENGVEGMQLLAQGRCPLW